MALFKIFGNFASGNTTLPTSATQGFCYFDKNTGKFYIDTTNAVSGRMALNAEKETQQNQNASGDYRILLSGNANDTTEIAYINKNTNLRFNPGTQLLSVGGSISATGDLTITGDTDLNGETFTESITTNSLLVNGNANFVQIPTAPTPANDSNDTSIATTAFVMNAFTANDAMIFKGTIGTGGTVTALPATHKQGWTYRVITAGTYAGKVCEIGDMIICVTDGTAASNDHWTVVQTNIDGAVTGPASATTEAIAIFNGTTGKIIKNSAKTITTATPAAASTSATIPTSNAVWAAISGASGYGKTGTVTSVQVQATAPVVSSSSASASTSLSTTISLANGYGDTKNPYAAKTPNYVLAGPSSGTATAVPTFRALVAADIPSLTKSKISDFPTSMPASDVSAWAKASTKPSYTASEVGAAAASHTHGNLSNDGKITTTATIANGDKLVIVDSDNTAGSKITGSSITFDGSTTTKALTQKGTWETFLQSHQSLSAYAPLASPALTGTPTAPTPATTSNDTTIATTEFVKSAISSGSMSDVTYTVADGSIAKVTNNTTTKIAADVPGYDPVTETITTIVDNVTVSGFYLDDDSDGNYNTQLYRSAANPLTGFTTLEDFSANTRYSVIWDGIEYSCYSFGTTNHPTHNEKLGDMATATSAWAINLLGNATLLKFASIEDNSSLPFVITYRYIKGEDNVIIWTNSTETSHTITIKKISRNYKKLAIEEIPFPFNHPNEGLAIKRGSGYKSLAFNNSLDAAGLYSITSGVGTYASGNNSIALGFGTLASSHQSIALGLLTQATKNMAISTGQQTKSSGYYSLTLGSNTQASGDASIAAGYTTVASHYAATALGNRSIASGAYSLVIGTDNIEDTNIVEGQNKRKYIFIAGNGTKNNRSNAATIDWNGNVNAQTSLGVADAVQMVYNATTQALDFVFA